MLNKTIMVISRIALTAIITMLLVLIAHQAQGAPGNWHLLEAQTLNMEVFKIASSRDGYMPKSYDEPDSKEQWRGGVAVQFDLDLLTYKGNGLYWDNRVHTEGTNSQVRRVGWQWEAGVRLGPVFDVYYYHHSQHIMDGINDQGDKFPLDNFYGVRMHFIRRANP